MCPEGFRWEFFLGFFYDIFVKFFEKVEEYNLRTKNFFERNSILSTFRLFFTTKSLILAQDER